MDAVAYLSYPLAFILALGILIAFHEYGHYCVARWCGVKVLRFSLGFGKIVWMRRLGADQTEWAVSAFPLGGYVKMLDEREAEVAPAEAHRAFNRQSLGKRSLIVVAGPLANLLLAAVLYALLFWKGSLQPLPILDAPQVGTPAAVAQLQKADQITMVDDEAVVSWGDFRWLLLQKAASQDSVRLSVQGADQKLVQLELPLQKIRDSKWEGDALNHLGLALYTPRLRPLLAEVLPNGVAAKAGLQAADEITAVNGLPLADWQSLVSQIQSSANRPIALQVRRQQQLLNLTLTPRMVLERGQQVGKIDVAVKPEVALGERSLESLQHYVSYGPFAAVQRGVRETWEQSRFTLVMIGRMFTGEVSLKNVSGPITIAHYAGKSAQLGMEVFLKFLAVISIGLGVMNLLPIPVLDGGHLLYHAIEAVWRRPLSDSFLMISQRLGMAALLMLTVFAVFNDVLRIFPG